MEPKPSKDIFFSKALRKLFSFGQPGSEVDKQETGQQELIVNIEHPVAMPRATVFHIQGWVASQVRVESVNVDNVILDNSERPDVRDAHPEMPYILGFHGTVSERAIDGSTLILQLKTERGVSEYEHRLKENPMLRLSKEEKFAKFNRLFPDDNAQQLVDSTANLELLSSSQEYTAVKSRKLKRVLDHLQCPGCGKNGELIKEESTIRCTGCAEEFDCSSTSANFLTNDLRDKFNIQNTENIASRAHDPLALALIAKFSEGLILDCGAGYPMREYENVVNYEIANYPTTDILGVGEQLPFADNSFDAVFSFSVLEHVKDPFLCASELSRTLKKGGVLYCSVPFLQPVHAYPHHYYNMTSQGLSNLFTDEINIIQSGIPISGQPLFSLFWLINSWSSGLSGKTRENFLNLTLQEIVSDPERFIEEPFVTELNEEKREEVACTSMVLGQKE